MVKSGWIFLVLLLTASCSLTRSQTCKGWQKDGYVGFTIDSCKKCIGQMGDSNRDAVIGCAIGIDSANLISGNLR